MTDSILTLTHATERDVDLLLVEELKCSEDFVAWLLNRIGLATFGAGEATVLHSVRRMLNRREIDIRVDIPQPRGKPIVLLIENKLDADEQQGQAISYADEKAVLVSEGHAASACTVLICPSEYAASMSVFAAKFDSTVSYEDVHSFLSERAETLTGEIARRIRYRAALMSQALDKARRGYEPIRIDGIAEFNREYVRLLGLYAPQVIPGPGLVRQQSKPSDSVSMIFDCQPTFVALPAELRPTRFAHELGRGKSSRANYVNVQFRGWDSGLARLTDASLHRFSSAGIEAEVWIDRRSGKGGLRLAIATPPVDNQALFNVVEPSVIEGIQSAARLHAWVMDNRDLLQQLLDLSI